MSRRPSRILVRLRTEPAGDPPQRCNVCGGRRLSVWDVPRNGAPAAPGLAQPRVAEFECGAKLRAWPQSAWEPEADCKAEGAARALRVVLEELRARFGAPSFDSRAESLIEGVQVLADQFTEYGW